MSVKAKVIESIEAVSSSLWFIPALFVLASFLLTYLTVSLDLNFDRDFTFKSWLFFSAGAESARSVLSTIAGSMITIAGVVFSITIVVLSLASSQYGPRLLDGFMKDRFNQTVLGVFIATFLYSILILKTISSDKDGFIPHYSVNVSILLSIFSVLFFIYYIHHTCKSIQANYIINQVCAQLSNLISSFKLKDDQDEQGERNSCDFDNKIAVAEINANRTGYIQYIDYKLLAETAEENNLQIRIDLRPGSFCPEGTKIGLIYSDSQLEDEEELIKTILSCLNIGLNRTYTQDLEYGFHQLVEIALRALSPGINDPFTAIICLDRITSCLIDVLSRKLPDGIMHNESGEAILIYKTFDYEGIIETAYRQIRQVSVNSLSVRIRIIECCNLIIESIDNQAAIRSLKKQITETKKACEEMNLSVSDAESLEERVD